METQRKISSIESDETIGSNFLSKGQVLTPILKRESRLWGHDLINLVVSKCLQTTFSACLSSLTSLSWSQVTQQCPETGPEIINKKEYRTPPMCQISCFLFRFI